MPEAASRKMAEVLEKVVFYSFRTFDYPDLGGIYAASSLITLPVLIMVLLVRRQFIRGLTIGGLKGSRVGRSGGERGQGGISG